MIISLIKKYIIVLNVLLIALIGLVFGLIIHDNITKPALSIAPESINSNGPEGNGKPQMTIASKPQPRTHYDDIITRNIFKINIVNATYEGDGELTASNGAPPETKLTSLILLATVNDIEERYAVLKNSETDKADSYKEGDIVDIYKNEKIKISRIESCKAVLERKNGYETIKCFTVSKSTDSGIPRPSRDSIRDSRRDDEGNGEDNELDRGIEEVGENEFVIDRTLFDELLSDINSIITQVRVIPQDDGIKLFGMRSNTFFNKIGLKNGDTLHTVNDVGFDNVENALGIFEDLKGESNFTINLTRRNQKMTFVYNVR